MLYRIVDVKQSQEDGSLNGIVVKLRLYNTSGSKRSNTPKERSDDSLEFEDSWLTLSDFCDLFCNLIIYHQFSSFKVAKSISSIIDPTKPTTTFKTPNILCILS